MAEEGGFGRGGRAVNDFIVINLISINLINRMLYIFDCCCSIDMIIEYE